MSRLAPLPSSRQPLAALPHALLSRVRGRLAALALVLVVGLGVQNTETLLWYLASGQATARRYAQGDLVSAGLAATILVVARARRIPAAAAVRIGRVLLVAICLTIGILSPVNSEGGPLPLLTWVTFVVAFAPLVIPSSPRSTVVFALAAAATAPVGMAVAATVGGVPALPTDYLAVSVNPLLAAAFAVYGSRIVHGSTVDAAVAEEQHQLLQLVLDETTTAVVVVDPAGVVIHANPAAERALGATPGSPWDPGQADGLPLPAAEADGRDGLYTGTDHGRRRTILFARRSLPGGQRLVLVREVTAEQAEHEVGLFREAIRYLVHELANTLSPIGTATRSMAALAREPQHLPRLGELLEGVNARLTRLDAFVRDYASLARLPPPRRVEIDWRPYLSTLGGGFTVVEPVPDAPALADPGQLQQVVANLVKNAHEAGSPPDQVTVRIEASEGGHRLVVADRGSGMPEAVAARATLPFFTTKPDGSGLGLALCRDVATGHGGHLSIRAREGGGTEVELWLPR